MATANRSSQGTEAGGIPLLHNLPLVLALALVVTGLAGLLPLLLSTNATTTSLTIRRLEEVRADWQASNLQLENEIAALGALQHVEREARGRLGMVPAEGTLQVAVEVAGSWTPYVPSRFLPPAAAEPQREQPWWRNLLKLLPIP